MRILIADPHNQVLRALHTLIIEKTDHRVVGEAFNLESLLLQVQEKQPDLVLLDWDLPGLTGAKLKKAASAWDHFPRLIVMSSKTDIKEAAIESGADAFVSKSVPASVLLEALKQIQDELTMEKSSESIITH